ncbi:Cof-type HAD-IIB family hydrolase [uncultured Ruminococcus sp.]|uniref:Cof-type HAD-IIB family hydrolase n=1 Tax=uncultured Ruminococcus sp. TaxID=165186 RepID=UPI0025FB5C9A|nr:Cof-type HAD-IIB family hydrolase [uncultured Ruminococcus sp.]
MFEDISKVLLITDMDGTFLPSSKVPGKRSVDAIADFQRKGGKFSIATGRAFQAAQQYFDSFSVNCPIIMCNGGMVYDLAERRQIHDVFVPDFTRDIVAEILRDNPDAGCEVLTLDAVYVPQMTRLEAKHNVICKVEPVICTVEEIPANWYKVLFAIEPEKMERLISYVQKRGWSGVDFVRSAPEYYEILPQNISKGSALEKMRRLCGMEDYTFVAMGDYNNDIEMLQAADLAVCPSNAVDEVKAVCDIVLDESCEEDAVAAALEYIYGQLG